MFSKFFKRKEKGEAPPSEKHDIDLPFHSRGSSNRRSFVDKDDLLKHLPKEYQSVGRHARRRGPKSCPGGEEAIERREDLRQLHSSSTHNRSFEDRHSHRSKESKYANLRPFIRVDERSSDYSSQEQSPPGATLHGRGRSRPFYAHELDNDSDEENNVMIQNHNDQRVQRKLREYEERRMRLEDELNRTRRENRQKDKTIHNLSNQNASLSQRIARLESELVIKQKQARAMQRPPCMCGGVRGSGRLGSGVPSSPYAPSFFPFNNSFMASFPGPSDGLLGGSHHTPTTSAANDSILDGAPENLAEDLSFRNVSQTVSQSVNTSYQPPPFDLSPLERARRAPQSSFSSLRRHQKVQLIDEEEEEEESVGLPRQSPISPLRRTSSEPVISPVREK